MSDLFWLSSEQLNRIKPFFPLSHGVPRADDLKVISGIVFVIKNGLRWRDAPKEYGPHKTLYNRFIRWSRGLGYKFSQNSRSSMPASILVHFARSGTRSRRN
jgi:transposase